MDKKRNEGSGKYEEMAEVKIRRNGDYSDKGESELYRRVPQSRRPRERKRDFGNEDI